MCLEFCRNHKNLIHVFFMPSNTLRQKLVHPTDCTPKYMDSNLMYAVQCSEECTNFYIGEIKQPLKKHTPQQSKTSSSVQDLVV